MPSRIRGVRVSGFTALMRWRAVKKLEITVPAAVTSKHMDRQGTDGGFR
jgi:hypothetical protein